MKKATKRDEEMENTSETERHGRQNERFTS